MEAPKPTRLEAGVTALFTIIDVAIDEIDSEQPEQRTSQFLRGRIAYLVMREIGEQGRLGLDEQVKTALLGLYLGFDSLVENDW